MRFIITTVYENVDQAWLDWYIARLKSSEVLPGSIGCVDDIISTGSASFTSKDPTSEVVATTAYEVKS